MIVATVKRGLACESGYHRSMIWLVVSENMPLTKLQDCYQCTILHSKANIIIHSSLGSRALNAKNSDVMLNLRKYSFGWNTSAYVINL